MHQPLWHVRLTARILLALIGNAVFLSSASAHVKWFAHYDVSQQPIVLQQVLTPQFGVLAFVSIVALLAGSLIELTRLGPSMLRAMDRVTGPLERNTELMFRAGCGFFFIAIWSVGNIILTPELHSRSLVIGAIQLMIAVCVLWRRTMPLAALGIAILYGISVWKYGIFHVTDYPIFLGVAAYIALIGLQRNFFGIRPLDIVRWSAGITLMWASVEKWAYPEWSYPLFSKHPQLAMGFSPEFFMRAAGWVEFALAFGLLWTPLVRRVSAVILTGMFVAAVFDFGKIDLVGHSLIIVVLLAIIADSRRQSELLHYPWALPFGVAGALVAAIGIYYGLHSLIYSTTFIGNFGPKAVTMVMATPEIVPVNYLPTVKRSAKGIGSVSVRKHSIPSRAPRLTRPPSGGISAIRR